MKYLARYAEPEAALASAISDSYLAALSVPACAESASLLRGFEAALANAPGRVLLIVVVNAPQSAAEPVHLANARLLGELAERFPERRALSSDGVATSAFIARAETHDLLWLDRASPGARLPPREGVGTARKIGGDLAAALWSEGKLVCPRLACSDADVTLPNDYFHSLTTELLESPRSAAWLWPFQHEAGGDSAIDASTVLYEIWLRYYVLGLAAAGSSYAYQSVGSTLCIDAPAYLSVRGFPKREAGEDFYLLDKLAKVGPLRRIAASPIAIRARASDRVPFGTGRRTQEIARETASGQDFVLYAPGIFAALASVLRGLDEFSGTAEVAAVERVVRVEQADCADDIVQVLSGLGVFAALESARTQAPAGATLRRRVHTWFDGLRTLRFVHGMRERCAPSVPWREALSAAPFVRAPWAGGDEPATVCEVLARAEAELPPRIGPALL